MPWSKETGFPQEERNPTDAEDGEWKAHTEQRLSTAVSAKPELHPCQDPSEGLIPKETRRLRGGGDWLRHGVHPQRGKSSIQAQRLQVVLKKPLGPEGGTVTSETHLRLQVLRPLDHS